MECILAVPGSTHDPARRANRYRERLVLGLAGRLKLPSDAGVVAATAQAEAAARLLFLLPGVIPSVIRQPRPVIEMPVVA